MDLAPALPPSQDTLPAFMSSADYLPQETDLDVVSLPAKSVQLSSVRPFLPNLPSGLIHSIAGIEAIGEKALSLSTGFVSVSGLSHSFIVD